GLAAAALGRAHVERALDLEPHDLALDRLGDEVEGAELHRLDRGLDRAEPGDDHDRHVRIDRADRLQHVDAGAALHLEIREHEVGAALLECGDPGGTVAGGDRIVAELLDGDREILADRVVVVDDQYGRHEGRPSWYTASEG